MFESMVKIRKFEEKVAELYAKGLIPGLAHLYIGQEAVAVGVCTALREDDYILSTHRGHGHAIAKGVPLSVLMAELMGKISGCCKGLSGSMQLAYLKKDLAFSSSIVGGDAPIAVGLALACKLEETDRVVVSFFGDGAINAGHAHEALNLAAIWKAPVIFV